MTADRAIRTNRLLLRPLTAQDAEAIARGMGNFEVTRWLTAPPWPYGLQDARDFLSSPAAGEALAIEIGDRLAGVVGRHPVREGGGGLELGYWLAEEFWGQGYMTEAAGAAVDDHFAHSDAPLQSGYILGNARSAHVLGKLGFRDTMQLQREARPLGETVTLQRVELTAEGHAARKGWSARTARLTYRPRQALDRDALHDLVSRAEVTRQLGPKWPWPADPDFTLTRSRPYQGQGFVWGIFREGVHVGSIGVTEGELGYVLHPDHHGQGLAAEAVERALTRAFDEDGLDRVTAGVWADNAASLGLLHKFGFRVTGETLGTSALRPDPAPGFTLELTRAEWQARAVIRSPRLVMRPMAASDAPLFHDLVTRPEVARFLYLFHPDWTLDEAREFLADWAWTGGLRFRLALIHQGAWAGWIGVTDDAEPEIFYALRPEFAGRGLASEAVAAFADFLFRRFDIPALTAGVFTDNPASARVLEKLGFLRLREEIHASKGRLAPAPLWVYRLERPSTPV